MNDRAVIGGNNPPSPLEAMKLHADELFDMADGSLGIKAIETPEQASQVEDILGQAQEAARDAEKTRKDEKQPHLDAGRDVDAAWKPTQNRLKLTTDACKALLTPWRNKLEEERLAEEKRLQEIADQKERDAQAAFEATKVTDLAEREKADELLKEAKKTTAAANKVSKQATGLRTYWNVTVTDYGALLAHMKENDPDGLKAMLDGYALTKKNANIRKLPGCKFTEEKRA